MYDVQYEHLFSDGFPCPYEEIPQGVFTLVPSDDDVTEIACEDYLEVEFVCDPEGTPFDTLQAESGTGRQLSPQTASCTPYNQGEVLRFNVTVSEFECIRKQFFFFFAYVQLC